MSEDLNARMSVAEAAIKQLQGESQRTRDQLRDLEPAVKVLGSLVDRLLAEMIGVARSAAREAVTMALEQRDERRWTRTEKLIAVAIALTVALLNLFSVHP
jgi:hypothetical protein